jgi:hypothetical protein
LAHSRKIAIVRVSNDLIARVQACPMANQLA